jgi:PAS domain S-box-containing protein
MTIIKSNHDKTKEGLIKELQGILERASTLEKEKTKLQQHVEMLEESENQYKKIIETQGEGVAIVNPNELFIYANPAAEGIFGVKPGELIGRNLEEFLEPEEFHRVVQQTEKRQRGEKSVYELEILRHDKQKRMILLTVSPFYDDSKIFKGSLATFRDITERKRAEEEVNEQKEILKAVIESSLDGTLVVDEKACVTHANERFYQMWHIPGELKKVQDHTKLLDYVLDQLEEPEAFLSRVRQLYESSEESLDTILFKDGRMFERVSFPLMREGNIVGRVWTFRDITEKTRAEEEKRKLEKKLQHALKMEAIGTLAGGIAHDFNNILAAIIGYTEMVSDDVPENSITMKNLQQVLQGAARAKELVKQILTFSSEDEGDRKPVLLENIVNESLNLLRASLPTTIDIRLNIHSPLHPILANQSQIHQVMMNLCTNAAYAMRENGGILEITLKEIDLNPNSIGQKNLEPGRYQQLSVSDTSTGIPPGIVNRIFEPYFTTKKPGEGSGMGLAVVYGIVRNHGGEITVYSEPGKGTTFHVYFKIAEIPMVSEEKNCKPGEIQGGNERVLFVDDELELAKLGEQILKNLGYQVVSATGSIEALEIFSNHPSYFDLVISDQTMPQMTGLQLTVELKKIRPDLPVIICTGFSENINEETYKSHGVNDFFMKPVTKKEIAAVIRRVLDPLANYDKNYK